MYSMQPKKHLEHKKAKKSGKSKSSSVKLDIDRHFEYYLTADIKEYDSTKSPQKPKVPIMISKCMLVELNSPLMDLAVIELDSYTLIFTISKNKIYFYQLTDENNLNYLGCEEIILFGTKLTEELTICRTGSYLNKDKLQDYLVVGGKTGLIYVIRLDNLSKDKDFSHKRLEGHANSIMDLAFPPFINPKMRCTLLSASRDGGIILWNYINSTQIALFRPARPPIDDVLSVSWNLDGTQFISSSLDEKIKLWIIDEKINQKINESMEYNGDSYRFPTLLIEDYELKANHLHNFYADQILYMNDFVITKDLNDSIYIWTWSSQNEIIKLSEFEYNNKDRLIGVKFDYFAELDLLTIAGDDGEIKIFQALGNSKDPFLVFQTRKCFIRKAIILKRLNFLICINEDGEMLVQKYDFFDACENDS